MKTFLLKSHFLTIVFLAANLFFASVAFGQATVTTDKDDYAPGEYVIITGTGWTPGETVTLHFDETPKPATCLLPHDMTAVADSSGNIYNNQFLIKINHIGVAFLLTATGQTSGLIATRNFTDANIQFTLTGLPNSSSSTVTIVYWTVANGQAQSVQTTTTETISVAANGNAATISVPAQPNTQLSWTFNNVTIGNNTYISSGSTSGLNSITSPITVNGNLTGNNAIKGNYASCTSPSAPTISSPVIYCLGTTPTALTATGSNLLWYSGATGGIGSSIAPTPSTNSSGTTSYYVSQTIGCESSRAKIDVTVNALPVAPNAGNYSGAYDGLPHVGSAVAGAGETIDWYTTLLGGNPTSAPSGTNVGVYSAYAEARNTTTGCVSTTRTLVSVTITKKAASVSPIANTKVYGSPEPVLTGTLVGFLEADAVTASYSRTSGETVLGTYSISAVLNPTGILSNYDITYNTAAFTITTKAASVSPIANTKVYGSPEPILTGTLAGFLEADAVTASYSRTSGETVLGTYSISAVLSPISVLSNYNITYNTAAFTITTKAASVSPIANTKVYGSPEPILTGTLAGFLEADAVTASYSRTAGETVIGGPYTISAVLSPTGVLSNYDITYNTASFTITTKGASVSPIANTKVYGSPEPLLTGTLVGFLEADAVTASYSRTAGETVIGGPYTISAVLSPTGVLSNYDITYNTALFTITTKAASVSPIANTKVYGSPEPILTGTLVGFLEADAVTASYSRTAGETVLGGPYTISAVLSPTGVLSNYDITYNTALFTITTKVASVSPIANTKVYGSPEPVLTGTLVGFLEADEVTASYSRTSGETVLGTYSISAVLSPTGVLSNYNITYNTAAFTITTKAASVSPIANTKVYGSPEPVLTGTLVGFLEADAVTASYSRTAGETVIGGPYTISAVLNPMGVLSNYDITYNTASFTITTKAASVSPIANTKVYGSPEPILTGTLVGFLEADAVTASYSRTAGETVIGGPYTISAVLSLTGVLSNYDITYNTALFTITTKVASVFPIANTKVYGSPEPLLTGTLVGFLEADAVTASYSRTAGETVLGGPYTISAVLNPTGVLSNYNITYNTAAFTITTKVASVSPIANTKVYGSPEPILTGTLVGFLEADAVTASYSRTAGETVIGGPYTISAVLNPTGVLSNYDITYNTASFTITTKGASVSPIANTKVYGSPEPLLTGTLVGFLEADAVTASYSRTAGETVIGGPYTISAVLNPTGVLSNYDITYNTALFTITTKAASVSPIANTKVYGSPEPILTGTLVGFLEADAVTASYSRTAGETVLGGPYTISAVLNPTGVLSNYDITYNTALFTITTKTASVSPIANTKVYGSPEPLLTGTLVGFLEADAVAASYSRTAGETVIEGPYTISAVLNPTGVLSNYDITYNTALFTITTKTASVSPIANTKVYGSPEPLLTGTLVGFLEADAITASYSRTAGETVLGGPYTISAVLSPTGVLSNYDITYNTAEFTITTKAASVSPIANTKVYGSPEPVLTGTLAGFLEADAVTASYSRTSGETVLGTYSISAVLSPASVLSNYIITYNTASFTITTKAASVSPIANTKVYGSPEPVLTGTLVGFLEADAVAASYSRTAGETVLGGPYTISAVLSPTGVLSNYDITYNTALFTITTKAASVSPIANTKVYGSPEPVLTGTLVGFLESDVVTASYSRTSGETVLGTYSISAVLSPTGVLSNYDITYNTALFTISKKTASVTPYVSSKYCGQNDPLLFTGNLAGFIGSDNVTAVYNRTAGEIAGGIYTISALLSPSSVLTNYNIDYNTALFTINSVLIDVSASSAPIALGSSATLSATVTSAVSGNLSGIPVLFTIDNGNGVITSYASQTNSSGLATFSVSNLSVEVYKIKAAAGSGCANATAYLAVYDPNGGFVTGGGWIMSPLGAYTVNPTLTGKANFGFNAKYKKGNTQVDGNTEFQFQTGNLNFSSSSHEAMSLVIAGAQAIYKGQGTINGVPGYSFMVSAIDGEKKSTGVTDKFRIKIWNGAGVVYDNQIGAADNADATTAIGGGSIVIHEVKKNGAAKVVIVEKTPEIVPFAITAYPNPSAQYFIIDIKGGTSEKTEVIVYDILGRMVKHIQNSDSKEIKFGEELSSGSYIAIINQGTQQKTVRLIKQ